MRRLSNGAVLLDAPPVQGFSIDPHVGTPDRPLEDILRERGMASVAEYLGQSRHDPFRGYARNKSYIGGRTAATAATARNVAGGIWNPSGSARIFCYEAWYFPTAASASPLAITRITARGTSTASATAAQNNSIENDIAAPSGFILDLTYSAQPTVSAANMCALTLPATAGNGVVLGFADPIAIPPGTGLVFITTQAVALPIADITFAIGD